LKLPKEVFEVLEQPDATVIATFPDGRIRVVSKLPREERVKLLFKAFLLESSECDEKCQSKVIEMVEEACKREETGENV